MKDDRVSHSTVVASAPGKLLLMGEHAVVGGYPCIVAAIDRRVSVSVAMGSDNRLVCHAPGVEVEAYAKLLSKLETGDVPKGIRFIEAGVAEFLREYPQSSPGITVSTGAGFSSQYGFGSSAAITVALIKALSALHKVFLSETQLFDMSLTVVKKVQKAGSGADVAAAVWGGVLWYESGGSVVEPLQIPPLPIVIGYSGTKADTVTMIASVREKQKSFPEKVKRIYEAISTLAMQAKPVLVAGEWERAGTLLNFNQDYLRDLGVSTEKLEVMIQAARSAGAYGAKLSGAGGGDCIIVLVPEEKRKAIEKSISKAGGEIVQVGLGARGCYLETSDDQEEIFVVVDEKDVVLGHRSRRDCHADPKLIHRGVSLLVFDSQGRVLLQKRSQTKDVFPGLWTTSVGGHVEKGETYEQAVIREAQEELGITIVPTHHSTTLFRLDRESEMDALFTVTHDGPFDLNHREVERVEFLASQELPRKLLSGEIVLTPLTEKVLKRVGFYPGVVA